MKVKFINALSIVGKFLLVIAVLFGIVIFSVISFAITGTIRSIGMADLMLDINKAALIIQTIAMPLAVLIVYLIFDKNRGLYLGWKQRRWWQLALQGCLWGIAFITTSFLLVWATQGIKITGISFSTDILSSLALPFVLYIGVAIGEEYLSRGYMHGLVRRDFGVKATIIVNSIVFALLHIANPSILQNPIPLANLFLAGVLFGVAREVTGGLWLPIGIHFTWNFFMGNIYGVAVSGLNLGGSIISSEPIGHPIISGDEFGLEGSIITTIVLIAYTIVIWKCYHCKTTKTNVQY